VTGAVGSLAAPPTPTGRSPGRVAVVVVLLAVGALGFHLGAGAPPVVAAAVAAAVLVAGCPVAVPLAGRVLPAAAHRLSERLGVPLGPERIALLGEVDTIVLPRSGAVTEGAPRWRATVAAPGEAAPEVLRLAAALERRAGHPLAAAVVAAAGTGDLPDVADLDELPGRGVRGVVAEMAGQRVVAHAVLVGSPAFLLEHGIDLPPELAAARERIERDGRVVLAVAWDGLARGVLDVDDPLRPGAAGALAAARRAGIRPVVLTGAGPGVAATLAERLAGGAADAVRVGQVVEVVAEPSPGSGAEVVRLLRARGAVVAGAVPGGGAVVDLPVPADGAAGLVDALLLARRVRRVGVVVGVLSSAAALLGAVCAAAGLLPLVLAPVVPAVGIALVAAGWSAVAATGRAAPEGATCG
jgi:Cu+-exporting ATPase